MIAALLNRARLSATYTAQSAALGFAGGVCLFIGLGFLTLAAWLVLLTLTSAIAAAVILGLAYAGAGLTIFGIVSARARSPAGLMKTAVPPVAPPPETATDMTGLMAAFLTGLTAGQKSVR